MLSKWEEDKAPFFTPGYIIGYPMLVEKLFEKRGRKVQKQDIIEPAASPWLSPVLLLKKKNGDFRFSVHYRRINNNIKRDTFPLPWVDDILENLRDSSVWKFFTWKTASLKSNLMKGAEITMILERCQHLIDFSMHAT